MVLQKITAEKNLVEKLINRKDEALSENERKVVTVFFADIRSFTTIAEMRDAEEVIFMLNEFFSIMVEIIFKNNGILDKLVGDQLMAIEDKIDRHFGDFSFWELEKKIDEVGGDLCGPEIDCQSEVLAGPGPDRNHLSCAH